MSEETPDVRPEERGGTAVAEEPIPDALEGEEGLRFLILGGGLQGTACAYDLVRQDDVESVTIADSEGDAGPDILPRDPRLFREVVDFESERAMGPLMHRHDVVLSAAPYYLNQDLARLAVEAGVHYSDLGGNTEIVFRQRKLADRAREAGSIVVPDVGLAPGMVNILAGEGIRRLDVARSALMYVGGLPQRPEPPLKYQVVYSLEGALDYYTTPSWIIRAGERRQIEPLSEVEMLEFEEVGTLEAFHTGGGASTLPWRYEDRVERLEYKTLRYPGHAEIMRHVRELGLLSTEPVQVDATSVAPRDVFLACLEPRLTRPDEPDLVVLRVVVEGELDGEPVALRWDLLDREDEATGITAMMRCTGFSLSIVGLLLARGVIDEPGVHLPDEAVPTERYLEELEERGIRVRHREESRAPTGG